MRLHHGRLALLLTVSALATATAQPVLAQAVLAQPVLAQPVLAPASARPEAERRFAVPAGPASTALNTFASQADVELFYPYEAVAGRTSPGLSGRYAPREALRRLLLDLPLVVAADNGRVITLVSRDGESPKDNAVTLAEVVVTGQRFQNREEIANRREALTIVDTLTQDDTGDLADQSIAEALRRVPGVATLYDEDEGSLITIRGAQPDWSQVTIDGMSVMPVGTGGAGRRQVDLALIPSQSSRTAEVFKTFTADLDANAVGGVLNLVPRSAYDRRRPQMLIDVYGNHFTHDEVPGANSMDGAKESPYGGGFNATLARRFGSSGQFGVVAIAGFQQKQRDQSKPATPSRLYFDADGESVPYGDPDWTGAVAPDGFVVHSLTNRLRNAGGSLRLEYRPSNRLYASLLAYGYTQDESETRNTNNLANLDRPSVLTPTTGEFRVREVRVASRFHSYDRASRGAQFHTNFRPDDSSLLHFGVGYSFASYRDDMPDAVYAYQPNSRLSYDVSDFTPTFTLETPEILSDPSNYTLKNATRTLEDTRGELTEIKLDYSRNSEADVRGWGLRAGLNWRSFQLRRDNEVTNYVTDRSSLSDVAFDPDYTPYSWPYPVVWLDSPAFWENVAPTLAINERTSAAESHSGDMKYRETIAAGYFQASYATDRARIIAGLRYDRADLSALIPQTVDGELQPGFIASDGGYDHLLPSLNLGYRLSDDWRVKAAYSRTIGRPNPRDLATAEQRDEEEMTLRRGNPDILPRKADNFDLALEHYFNGRGGMVTLGAFHKAITDDIFTQRTELEIDGQIWSVRQPVNANEATLSGVEFAVIDNSLPLLGALGENLGLAFNVTRLWGETTFPVGDTGLRTVDRQVGQMDWAGNLALFYSLPRGGEVRVAGNYQGEYVTALGDDASTDSGWRPFVTWDVSVRHRITDRMIVKVQARNLTDENRTEVFGDGLRYRHGDLEFGRSFYLNLIYKL